MQPRFLIPKVGANWTWTKQKWKAIDGYCRSVERAMGADFPQRLADGVSKLFVFGHCLWEVKGGRCS